MPGGHGSSVFIIVSGVFFVTGNLWIVVRVAESVQYKPNKDRK